MDNSLMSSPPSLPLSRGKEKRNPSITPRKFKRFFTPRSRVSSQPSPARKALHDLTAPALNRSQTPSSPLKPILESNGAENRSGGLPAVPKTKRRKIHHTPESSPTQPCYLASPPALLAEPEAKPALLSPIQSLHPTQSSQDPLDSEDDRSDVDLPAEPQALRRPARLTGRGLSGHLVQRMMGGMPRPGRQFLSCPVSGEHRPHPAWSLRDVQY
jgi:hypothetical protein